MARLRIPSITTAQRTTVTPLEREVLYDTDLNRPYSGDGSTAGAQRIALYSEITTIPSGSDASAATATATGSTTARTLADRFAEYFRPEDFGCVGDGTTNDTTNFQAALDALGEGDCLLLKPGAVYSVTNLTLPTNTAALTSGLRNGLICLGGMATIKCRSGGDADYMVATDRWLTGNASKADVGSPWYVANVNFDGNGIATRTVVSKNFWTHWEACYFQGATTTNFEFTRQNEDASDGHNGSFLSDSVWRGCRFRGAAATYHFRTVGTAGDANAAASDGTLDGCEFSQAADYGAHIASAAGWTIHTNRFYSQTSAGLYILRLGRGHSIADNNFDSDGTAPAVIVGEVGSYPDGMIGPGNKYYADIRVDFKDDTSTERVKVRGEHFFTQQAGSPDAVAIHNNNRSQKTLTLQDCDFEADPIYERGVGNTAGIIEVFDCTSASASGDAKSIAFLKDDPGATAGPVIRKVRRSASPAAADVLPRDEYIGDDSGGNLTTYAAVEVAIGDPTHTSEDGVYRVKIMVAGSEVTAVAYDANGATVRGNVLLDSGAVLNFASSNYTVTHSSGLLTFSGALSLGVSNAFTCGSIELGHASENTLTAASGDVSIEGNVLYRAGGTDVPVADGGTGASTAAGAMANLSGWHMVGSSAATGMSHTGNTSVTTLATIAVPAGAIGPNGRLRVRTLWTLTNDASNKTLRVNYGGTTFQTHVSASQASYRMETEICNRNDAAVQISNSVQAQGGWGNTTTANPTGTVDTTGAQNVTITVELADGTDTGTLEAYAVEVFYKA